MSFQYARRPSVLFLILLALGASLLPLHAQVPQLINYQGRVAVGTPAVNFDGSGSFKFALVNTNGTVTYWSNDGTSTAGSQPTAAVSLAVTKGLYSVLLGDATLANMTIVPATVFTNPDVRLRVWFNDGTNGSQLLTPDQRIAAVGYAMMAAGVNLPTTTSSGAGVITQNSNRLLHTFGTNNFFAGSGAGNFTLTGSGNTGVGNGALDVTTTGSQNTAVGADGALGLNSTGNQNTAIGDQALALNIAGSSNTGIGFEALGRTTANNNTAIGHNALFTNTTGTGNIALGLSAGFNLTTGSGNIDIGHVGVAAEANIIRIGTSQTDTYLTGIIHGNGSALTGVPATVAPSSITNTQLATTSGALAGQVLSFSGSSLIWIPSGTLTLPYSQNGSASGSGALFSITNSSTGTSVMGVSATGKGVFGSSTSGNGVFGQAGTGGNGVYGDNPTGTGVAATSNSGFAMYAASNTSHGIYAQSGSLDGVHGVSTSGSGVYGTSTGGYGGTFAGTDYGVNGTGSLIGVRGSGTGYGVQGQTASSIGVYGLSTADGDGVYGTSATGKGVYGRAVVGNANVAGVWGENTASFGTAVVAKATNANGSTGLYAKGSGMAGFFDGNLTINDIGGAGNSGNAGTTSGKVFFGASTRQMLNLWGSEYGNLYAGTEYGIGVQNFALYFRSNTGAGFAWFQGGGHNDNKFNAGTRTGLDSGTTLMTLDTLTPGTGGGAGSYGLLTVGALTIRGGSDLAEPFKMTKKDIPPGSVVIIDDQNPGHLKLSEIAYDRRVAGIVSGANGVRPGIALQQDGVLEGDQNVALSGRVYVQADTSNGPIKPGDMLTTSDTPGHAMKAADHERAQGAIIGKAMSTLDTGTGMVLVLVTLQ